MIFKHFVITRFNLKMEAHFQKDKTGKLTQTEDWLKTRFYLFDTYCFPSLKNQTCRDFIWFVLFDINTPDKYLQRITEYKNEFSNFYPLFLESGDSECINRNLNIAIKKEIDEATKYVITSRIDNDDAFHMQMIDDVQKRFDYQDDLFFNFEYGLQYDLKKKILVKFLYKKNHFLSRIEKLQEPIQTVISVDHTQIDTVAEVENILQKHPLWIEVVHDSNISNSIRLSKPIFFKSIFEEFGFLADINYRLSIIYYLQYLKVQAYLFFGNIALKLGLFSVYKKLLKLFK